MRQFIDLTSILCESVCFHPSEMTEYEGSPYVKVPDRYVRNVEHDCQDCQGSGVEHGHPCVYCQGTGKEKEKVWDVPQLDVANRNAAVIAGILGDQYGDGESGWIAPEKVADAKRTLIRLMNTGTDAHEIEPSETRGKTRVDRSGDTPRIQGGAQFYDYGLSGAQIDRYARELMSILDFAQKNGLGVSWA